MVSSTVLIALLPVLITLLLDFLTGLDHDADAGLAVVLNRIVLPVALFSVTLATSRTQSLGGLPLALALFMGLVVPHVAVVWKPRDGRGCAGRRDFE